MGSLQAHESRINRSLEKNEEKAFQVKEAATKTGEIESSTSRGHGSGGFCGRGRGRGRGRSQFDQQKRSSSEQRSSGEQRSYRSGIQCHHCKKFGHKKGDCWYKDQQVNYATENGEESKLFIAHLDTNYESSDVWFVDRSYSNHMTGMKSKLKELDETHKMQVKLGNGKEI
ncbi:hypothetical protein Patl1_24239 [Pistacia atlantica]|uniref:Uncharacterized protein n=1 Tax=Pistacia atlantica TaxID=434234 RepID=A0ACC0ZZU4_9ROSI|nr:hypothetical protein Patl1_24239 [Pistacia atlantica]